MEYKFSIIIPHKDVPDLLDRCLDSIPSHKDFQVIVVDDASKDKQNIRKVEVKYPHVEFVYTTESKGAGFARNIGMKRASGCWLIFADADDFFEKGFVDLLQSHYHDTEDIIYFNAKSVYSTGLNASSRLDKRNKALLQYMNKPSKISDYCRYFYTEPWGKMLKASFLVEHSIIFDETIVANDFFFSVSSGYYAKQISFDVSVLYVYTEREGSLSNAYCANELVLKTRLKVYKRVQDFLDAKNIPYNPFFRFSMSEYRNPSKEFTAIVREFWKHNNMSMAYVLYRYIIGKLYQYTLGVHI